MHYWQRKLLQIKRESTHSSSRAACHRYLLSGRCRLSWFGIVSLSFITLDTKQNVADGFILLFYDVRKVGVCLHPHLTFEKSIYWHLLVGGF